MRFSSSEILPVARANGFGGGVAVAYAVQGVGVFGVAEGEGDGLIGGDALMGVDRAAFLDLVPHRVIFRSRCPL